MTVLGGGCWTSYNLQLLHDTRIINTQLYTANLHLILFTTITALTNRAKDPHDKATRAEPSSSSKCATAVARSCSALVCVGFPLFTSAKIV